MYGEWLREQFDKGAIPEPTYDPDLAILLPQLRENSITLFGPEATEVIEPVPMTDIRRAIKESLPGLIASIEGDEHNVILTLARMWLTSSSSRICSKDQAAERVIGTGTTNSRQITNLRTEVNPQSWTQHLLFICEEEH